MFVCVCVCVHIIFPVPHPRMSKSPTTKKKVFVVIGAGLAGLLAAHALLSKCKNNDKNSSSCGHNSLEVFVLEKNDRPGGRMQTARGRGNDGGDHERGAWRVQGNGSHAETLIRNLGGTLTPFRPRPTQEKHVGDQELLRAANIKKTQHKGGGRGLSVYDVCCLTKGAFVEADTDKGYHGLSDRAIGTRSYSTGSSGDQSKNSCSCPSIQ